MAAALAHSVDNLVVGKDGAKCRTPVHYTIAKVGEAVVHQRVGLFLIAHGSPVGGGERELFCAGGVYALSALFGEMLLELFDGHGAVGLAVVVRAEHLEESPLGPFVILGVAGADLAAPVKRQTDVLELLDIAGYIFIGGDFGVLAGLYGMLLGGQTVGVEAHGVEHIEAAETFVARIDVARDVA